jgi:hypothetical protein
VIATDNPLRLGVLQCEYTRFEHVSTEAPLKCSSTACATSGATPNNRAACGAVSRNPGMSTNSPRTRSASAAKSSTAAGRRLEVSGREASTSTCRVVPCASMTRGDNLMLDRRPIQPILEADLAEARVPRRNQRPLTELGLEVPCVRVEDNLACRCARGAPGGSAHRNGIVADRPLQRCRSLGRRRRRCRPSSRRHQPP